MAKKSGIAGVPDAFMTARDWWLEGDARLLPGEVGGVTVFEILYEDGCRYFGYTEMSVFDLVNDATLEAPERFLLEIAWRFMDAGVVPKVATSCNGGRFEPEKWSRRREMLRAGHCRTGHQERRCRLPRRTAVRAMTGASPNHRSEAFPGIFLLGLGPHGHRSGLRQASSLQS